MVSTYLSDIIVLLIAAVLAVPFFQAIRLGAVPGFLLAGVIVGPSLLGLINNVEAISQFSEIGVVLLLFIIGIELKPSRLWLMRRLVFGLGTLQVLITGSILSIIIAFCFDLSIQTAILIGPALALSSTAFVVQLLKEQKSMMSSYGRTAFSILLLQDLAVVPLLALIPLMANPDINIGGNIGIALLQSLLILFSIITIGRYLLHPILHRVAITGSAEVFTSSAVLIVLGTAWVTEYIGLSMAMGAFLAGLLISDSAYRHQIMAEIQPFSGLLLGLFFICMGMSVNLQLFLHEPQFFISMTLALITLKAVILLGVTCLFGLKKQTAIAVSLILAQSGEFALVVFALATESNLLTEFEFQHLLLIVLLSMLFTPLLASIAYKLGHNKYHSIEYIDEPTIIPVVIAGYGRLGKRIGEILKIADQPFVALDIDPLIVKEANARGEPVYYGDVSQKEVLKAAGARDAKFIIVTFKDLQKTEKIITFLHTTYPHIYLVVRAQAIHESRRLRKLGASMAVSEHVEMSLSLASIILQESGLDEKEQYTILNNFRRSYYAQIDDTNYTSI